jgi:hypothetical protein
VIELAAIACNAALVSWGILMVVLGDGGWPAHALAAYVAAYGALNLWLILGGARTALAMGRAASVRKVSMALNASLPLVFLGLALADGGAPLEWVGAALMALPAWLNGRATRRAAGGAG